LPWSAFLRLSASSEAVGGWLGTATVDMVGLPIVLGRAAMSVNKRGSDSIYTTAAGG
jgi:hypothetical protein